MLKAVRKATAPRDGSDTLSRRLADIASARLWLADGFPVADVLTMLEVRRRFEFSPHVARAYAVEILSAAKAEIQPSNQPFFTHLKEMQNAAA